MLFSPSADGVTRDRAARDAVGVAPWLGIQVRHLAALESDRTTSFSPDNPLESAAPPAG